MPDQTRLFFESNQNTDKSLPEQLGCGFIHAATHGVN